MRLLEQVGQIGESAPMVQAKGGLAVGEGPIVPFAAEQRALRGGGLDGVPRASCVTALGIRARAQWRARVAPRRGRRLPPAALEPLDFALEVECCGLIKTDTLIRVIRLRKEVSYDDRETQDLYGRVQA